MKPTRVDANFAESSFGKMSHVVTVSETDRLLAEAERLSSTTKRIVLLMCVLTVTLEGANLSLPGPFFPAEAEKKGLSQTQIGLVVGSVDVANLIFSFVVASLVSAHSIKFFFVWGTLWSSITVGAFGVLGDAPDGTVYFVSCLVCRVCNGVGASMLYSTALPIAVQVYPERAGVITTIIQTSLGFGLCLGPPVGSVLLPLGGYRLPFLCVAAIEFIVASFSLIFVPSKGAKAKSKVQASDYIIFITKPSTLSVAIPAATIFCICGVRDSAYSLYFENTLGLTSESVGYIFTANSVAYFLAGPIVGVLVEFGFGGYIVMITQFIAPMISLGFFLPKIFPVLESVYWGVSFLFGTGFVIALMMNPTYLVFEKVALRQGLTNMQQIKTIAASCYNLQSSFGRTFGSFVIGGYLNEQIGFYYMSLAYAVMLAVTGLWYLAFLWKNGLIRRLYYHAKHADGNSELSSEMKGAIPLDTTARRSQRVGDEESEDDSMFKQSVSDILLTSMGRSQILPR